MGKSASSGSNPSPATASQLESVTFEHPFFSRMEKGFFHIHPLTGEPVMAVHISNNEALLPFPGLKREFNLNEHDCRMLDVLADGLKYVNGLKMGEALPKEILTGEASWDPSKRHELIAHQRITMQLVSWMSGSDTLITDPDELLQLAEDPATKKRVNDAFGEAAERIGIGRNNREQMLEYVKKLSHELAYVEALRDKMTELSSVQQKVLGLRKVYSRERSVAEVLDQVVKLVELAMTDFSGRFLELDGQTGEILAVLKNLENQVLFIRDKRDDLHIRLMAWDDVIRDWKSVEVCVSYKVNDLIAQFYRFLAPRFMKVDDWVLMTKLQIHSEKLDNLKRKNRVLVW
ncbi:hypothetical protein [Telmatospirillum sp.]|uniref:hypothetical protein n=1 Tax=Telmatospirillum sp. TaxID=2079197 RepID=UPI0028500DF7|nr:hypothetical protein [Telmatospirillum sp.]MDR3435499.1 hypothetical protein [Telmatospirillum sp.]